MSATSPGLAAPGLRRLPFIIKLAPQFVNRLLSRRQQTASPDSIQGLLFGIADETSVVVQAFRSFAASEEGNARESETFDSLLASAHNDPEISPLELVGWYAARTSGGLLQSDIRFHNLHFQRPNDLALVLKPEGDASVLMELYCRSADGVLSSEGHRWGAVRQALGSPLVGPVEVTMRSKIQDDFFLRAYQASSPEEGDADNPGWKDTIQLSTRKALGWLAVSRNEKARSEYQASQALSKPSKPASLQPIYAGAPPGIPALIPETRRQHKVPWISSVVVFAIAAGLTFGLVYSRGLSSGDHTPGFLSNLFPAPGLGLRLESQGDRLLLSWNRHHPAVRNSKGGILQIDDGAQHRQVLLDAAQVSNGSVLYRPTSDDVTFRLEVESIQNGKVSETMRVLDTAKPATLDLSAPPTATATPSMDHPVVPQAQPNSGATGSTAVGQVPNAPTQKSAAVVPRRLGGTTADSPVVSPSPAAQPLTPAKDTQPAPPPPAPADIPIKKAEAQGQVNFDVLPAAPAPAGKGESGASTNSSPASGPTANPAEIVRSTPQEETSTAPAPVIEKQNPERQNPLPVPATVPIPNAAVPKALSPRSAPASYRAPRPLRQVLPNTSSLLPGILAAAGRVEVIVKVDERGHVTEARLVNGAKKVNATLAGASLLAAKQWVFEPAALNGKPVPSEHSVIFQFQTPK